MDRKRSIFHFFPFLVLSFLLCGFMDFFFDQAYKGNEDFAQGRYDQASRRYTEAGAKNPDDPALDFNLGAALYKQGKHEDALSAFQKSYGSKNVGMVADARYNSGNALFRQGKLAEAISEYIEALKLRPEDEDAKYNLELARRLLQQRQEKEEDQPPQDKKDPADPDQEEQNQEGQNQESQDQEQEARQPDEESSGEEKAQGQDASQAEEEPEQVPAPKPAAPEEDRESTELAPESAARILDSLKKDERDEIIRQMLPRTGFMETDKDW